VQACEESTPSNIWRDRQKAHLERCAVLLKITALHPKSRFMRSLAGPHRELRLVFRVPFRVTDERSCRQGRETGCPVSKLFKAEIPVDARVEVTA
jgi:hypothetical protein